MASSGISAHRLCFWSNTSSLPLDAQAQLENVVAAASGGVQIAGKWTAQVAMNSQILPGDLENARMPVAGSRKDLHIINLSDFADTLFLVVKADKKVMAAESNIKALFDSLKLLKHRATLQLDGTSFSLDDGSTIVCIARANHLPSNNFLGLVVSIYSKKLENSAAQQNGQQEAVEEMYDVIADMVNSQGGKLQPINPAYEGYALPANGYTKYHMAADYVQLMQLIQTNPQQAR